MSFIESIREKRQKYIDGVKANEGAINIEDIFKDFYPDKAHFIYELLQNAEDAGATKVRFTLDDNKLIFEHNGRPFEKKDIESITGIGFSEKSSEADKIGRFGIGFKAVFLYTDSPRIWSPNHSFEISDMVIPSALSSDQSLGERTRFEFPFNSKNMPRRRAFKEIRNGLSDISDDTLLFLSKIKEIEWNVNGIKKESLRRDSRSNFHVEISRESKGENFPSSHFLCFKAPADGLSSQHVAIAFDLEPRSDGNRQADMPSSFATRFRVVSADSGLVAVYFMAKKETSNLRFHLHAPFVPDPSRSSVKDTPDNDTLFQQLADLAARSLHEIQALGLLDREFLSVLPNSRDKVQGRYDLIREAIVDVMKEQPLTPTHAGHHAPADQLLQAEAKLKDLLGGDDVRFLIDDADRFDWAVSVRQKNGRVDRFLHDLGVEQWGVEEFVGALKDCCSYNTYRKYRKQEFLDWMRKKPVKWHRELYALFHEVLKKNYFDRFRGICVVRCSNKKFGTGSKCYFPTSEMHEGPFLLVEEDIYAGGNKKKRARER